MTNDSNNSKDGPINAPTYVPEEVQTYGSELVLTSSINGDAVCAQDMFFQMGIVRDNVLA